MNLANRIFLVLASLVACSVLSASCPKRTSEPSSTAGFCRAAVIRECGG